MRRYAGRPRYTSVMLTLPTYGDVAAAAARIRDQAHRTPVMTSRTVNQEIGAEVFFKCENLQRTGAFKFRGAFNALSKLPAEQRCAGVVTFSSGNHAQAEWAGQPPLLTEHKSTQVEPLRACPIGQAQKRSPFLFWS